MDNRRLKRKCLVSPLFPLAVFLAVTACIVNAAPTPAPVIVISEVMFNPNGDENAREYVELHNISEESVSMEGCLVGDGEGFDPAVPVRDGGWEIPPGGFAVIFDPDYFDGGEPYEGIPGGTVLFTVTDSAIGLRGLSNSTAEPVSLVSAAGDTLSTVRYSTGCAPGFSWERILPSGGDDRENFAQSLVPDGTPGRKNSVTPPPIHPALDKALVRFMPDHPNMGDTVDIAVAFRNEGLDAVDSVRIEVSLVPGKPAGEAVLDGTVYPGGISAEERITLFSVPGGRLQVRFVLLALDAAAADTLNVTLDTAIEPGAIVLNEVMAAPPDGAPEWVEILNTGAVPVDLYNAGVKDDTDTFAIVFEHVFLDVGGYAILAGGNMTAEYDAGAPVLVVENFPRLNNDGDSVTLYCYDGSVIDMISYADTQTGISFERMSPGCTEGAGCWDFCVDPSGSTPGKANSIAYDPDTGAGRAEITVDPNPFDASTIVSYELPFPVARVSLFVYDRRGRLVAKIRDGEESGSSWSGEWDGTDGGTRLPAGPYILNLEALDKRTGRVATERKAVVVASRL